MNPEKELQKYDVSRETFLQLEQFVALLKEWNEKINLVSRKSIDDVWSRHVLDSAQLVNYIPNSTKLLLDIGSGSGFPAIVLAIMLRAKYPELKFILVESITKKAVYLKDVCTKLGLTNVIVENNRVENIVFKNVDVITARAVAALDVLCGYAYKAGNKRTKMLLLKGKSYNTEHESAQQKWQYNMQVHKNEYGEDGVVLEITNIRKR
ncbi:MAG: 16S rRNA (guanine(527)-N(7))-methyltransferase RsmG [Alphaproteobacteria bacterium]|nr:16S rRNA (guanine(527)-N(7))-methyltransferase RsmG [Alphaproteobacteria bacterium]